MSDTFTISGYFDGAAGLTAQARENYVGKRVECENLVGVADGGGVITDIEAVEVGEGYSFKASVEFDDGTLGFLTFRP